MRIINIVTDNDDDDEHVGAEKNQAQLVVMFSYGYIYL